MRAETVAETTGKETVATTRVGDILGYARVSTADQTRQRARQNRSPIVRGMSEWQATLTTVSSEDSRN